MSFSQGSASTFTSKIKQPTTVRKTIGVTLSVDQSQQYQKSSNNTQSAISSNLGGVLNNQGTSSSSNQNSQNDLIPKSHQNQVLSLNKFTSVGIKQHNSEVGAITKDAKSSAKLAQVSNNNDLSMSMKNGIQKMLSQESTGGTKTINLNQKQNVMSANGQLQSKLQNQPAKGGVTTQIGNNNGNRLSSLNQQNKVNQSTNQSNPNQGGTAQGNSTQLNNFEAINVNSSRNTSKQYAITTNMTSSKNNTIENNSNNNSKGQLNQNKQNETNSKMITNNNNNNNSGMIKTTTIQSPSPSKLSISNVIKDSQMAVKIAQLQMSKLSLIGTGAKSTTLKPNANGAESNPFQNNSVPRDVDQNNNNSPVIVKQANIQVSSATQNQRARSNTTQYVSKLKTPSIPISSSIIVQPTIIDKPSRDSISQSQVFTNINKQGNQHNIQTSNLKQQQQTSGQIGKKFNQSQFLSSQQEQDKTPFAMATDVADEGSSIPQMNSTQAPQSTTFEKAFKVSQQLKSTFQFSPKCAQNQQQEQQMQIESMNSFSPKNFTQASSSQAVNQVSKFGFKGGKNIKYNNISTTNEPNNSHQANELNNNKVNGTIKSNYFDSPSMQQQQQFGSSLKIQDNNKGQGIQQQSVNHNNNNNTQLNQINNFYNSIQQARNESSLNRSQAASQMENFKLEEKIKELQLNLQTLPTSFNRPKSKSNYANQQQHSLPPTFAASFNANNLRAGDTQQQQPQHNMSQIQSKLQFLRERTDSNDFNRQQSQRNEYNSQENMRKGSIGSASQNNTARGEVNKSQNNLNDKLGKSSLERMTTIGMTTSTLSTSPDKKSPQASQIDMAFNKRQPEIIIEEEGQLPQANINQDQKEEQLLIQCSQAKTLSPSSSQAHFSPSLRKKISDRKLHNQDSNYSSIQESNNNSKEEQKLQIQENNYQELYASVTSNNSTKQPNSSFSSTFKVQSINEERTSLTKLFKKSNQLGQGNPSKVKETQKVQSSTIKQSNSNHTPNSFSSKANSIANRQEQSFHNMASTFSIQAQQQRLSLQPASSNQKNTVSIGNNNSLKNNGKQQTCVLSDTQAQQLHSIKQKKPPLNKKKIIRDKIEEGDERQECETCGRRFNEEAYSKHIIICEKVFIKKRKEFNTQKQRVINQEHSSLLESVQSKIAYYENSKLNQKWKIHSAQFRAAIESAKTGKTIEGVPDDRVQCEYCGRKFAEQVAERHRPICQKNQKPKQSKKIAPSTTSAQTGKNTNFKSSSLVQISKNGSLIQHK